MTPKTTAVIAPDDRPTDFACLTFFTPLLSSDGVSSDMGGVLGMLIDLLGNLTAVASLARIERSSGVRVGTNVAWKLVLVGKLSLLSISDSERTQAGQSIPQRETDKTS